MATEERDKEEKVHDDGSPITVGSGGGKDKDKDKDRESNISCTFRDEDYPEQGNADHHRRRFRAGGRKINTFKIRRRNGPWEDHSDVLPANGDCEITITCEGSDDDVIINGRDFGIDMNPDVYRNMGNGKHTNPNADSFISRVVVTAGGLVRYDQTFFREDDCAVCTDRVANSPSCR
jgi:hypothetical protein